MFSGIGAFEKALNNMSVNYELVNYCEIDKYASKSYAAIHNVPETMNLGDITKVDTSKLPNDITMVTYGFPCQDISLAGRQKGFEHDGERTRSGLFFEALRIIEDCKPKFAICENVKNLTSKKFANEFEIVLSSLEEAGYKNYWKVLNAKDYGIPQNRERVFIISIRKDIDKGYEFPEPFPLQLRLKDMLEADTEEKYYLSGDLLNNFILRHNELNLTSDIKDSPVRLGNVYGEQFGSSFGGNVWEKKAIAPTLKTTSAASQQFIVESVDMNRCSSENCRAKVVVREATKKGYSEAYEGDSINLEQPNSKTRRGRVGKQVAQTLNTSPQQAVVEPVNPMPDGTCRTIKNQYYKTSKANYKRTGSMGATGVNTGLKIRKLTPKECFRLMGFSDEDFEKAEATCSNTQLYRQAGNSIVVDVIEELYEKLFERYWNEVK